MKVTHPLPYGMYTIAGSLSATNIIIPQSTPERKKPFVGLKTRFFFFVMSKMQSGGMGSSPMEKTYWQENGWLDKKRPWK